MKKKLLLIMIMLFGIFTLSGGGKKNENKENTVNNGENNNTEVVEEPKTSIVISNADDKIYVLNDKFELVWKYDIKGNQAKYDSISFDGDYLYYTDGENLYRKNIRTNGDIEDLGIKLSGYWYFYVKRDILVYTNVDSYNYVNLENKNVSKLDILGSNKEALTDEAIYYTDKEDESLKSYNIITKEINTISANARIEEMDKDEILYVNDKNEYILYNYKNKTSKVVLTEEYAYMSGLSYPIHLYNNGVYTFEGNKLNLRSENRTIYTHELGENEKVLDFIMLGENKFLLAIFIEDKTAECLDDICDPVGEMKYLLVDNKNNKTTEIKENVDILSSTYEYQYIY